MRHRLIVAFAVAAFSALLFLWCSKRQNRIPVPETSPMANAIRFQYAVYFLSSSSNDAPAVFHEVLAKEYPSL
jgi:hypothetical protein